MSPTTTMIQRDVSSSPLNTDDDDDLPLTGINRITNTSTSNDGDDVAKVIDDSNGVDVSITFSPVWEPIVLDEENLSTGAIDGGIITDLINIDESNTVDNVNVVADGDYNTEDDDDLSVTFSTVWEEIVIPPSTATSTLTVVQELPSSSNRVLLPTERSRMGFPSSRSSSSFSSTTDNIPFRGSYHSSHHSTLVRNNRSRMMEDSRSLDSMTVMYDPTNQNRNHINQTRNMDSSHTGVVPAIVAFGSTGTSNRNNNELDDEPDSDRPPSRATRLRDFRRILCWSLRLMFFPIWLLISVFTVSTVIAFCILPGILILSIMISCYYCCSRDPIPFNVLLQALLLDDVNNNSENMNAPTRTKDEIRELLICRTCTKAQPRNRNAKSCDTTNENDAASATNTMIDNVPDNHQPDREEIVSRGPIYVATENFILMYSDQILPSNQSNEEEEKDQADEENVIAPRLSLPVSAVENDHAVSSVDAVQVLSTDGRDGAEEDVEVHADDQHNNRNDIEQGRHGIIEMTAVTRTETIETFNDQLDALSFTELKNKGETMDAESSTNHDDDDDDYFESGIGCDICLRRYQQNDIVAWSHNEQCIHAYHLHCITDWLQKKITCPNCRCRYIPKHSDNQHQKRNVLPPTQPVQERIVQYDENNDTATIPAANAAIATASGTALNTAARTSVILQHQRNVTTLHL